MNIEREPIDRMRYRQILHSESRRGLSASDPQLPARLRIARWRGADEQRAPPLRRMAAPRPNYCGSAVSARISAAIIPVQFP
jgi:hypothetical protein